MASPRKKTHTKDLKKLANLTVNNVSYFYAFLSLVFQLVFRISFSLVSVSNHRRHSDENEDFPLTFNWKKVEAYENGSFGERVCLPLNCEERMIKDIEQTLFWIVWTIFRLKNASNFTTNECHNVSEQLITVCLEKNVRCNVFRQKKKKVAENLLLWVYYYGS